jgi:hypothetical protein
MVFQSVQRKSLELEVVSQSLVGLEKRLWRVSGVAICVEAPLHVLLRSACRGSTARLFDISSAIMTKRSGLI